MDHKMRAAGDDQDQDHDHLQTRSENVMSGQSERQTISLELAKNVLEDLEAFTLQKVSDVEVRAKWIIRLSRVQQWRLQKLNSFTGRLEQVWKFLDEVRADPERPSEDQVLLPRYDRQFAKDFMEYMVKSTAPGMERNGEEHKRLIKEFRDKYPDCQIA